MIEIIEKYFPNLTEEQKKQFEALDALYHDWNSKINVISRKDIDNLYEHHVLHSLAIARPSISVRARRFSISAAAEVSRAFRSLSFSLNASSS